VTAIQDFRYMSHVGRIVVVTLLVSMVLASCGGERRGPDRREAGQFSRDLGAGPQQVRSGPSANEAYVSGINARTEGNCALAIDILRPVANLGPGYEGAQFALGDCLVRTAPTTTATAFADGMTWLIRAADAGWAEAQGRLAEIYAIGANEMRNLDEAAYWISLYRLNAQKARIGFQPLPDATEKAIMAALSPAQLDQGKQRALLWQRTAWLPPNKNAEPPIDDKGRPDGRARRPPPSAMPAS